MILIQLFIILIILKIKVLIYQYNLDDEYYHVDSTTFDEELIYLFYFLLHFCLYVDHIQIYWNNFL